MDTLLLKNFLVLAKTKNFTKAAHLLYCSQSALSLQIKRLEEEIGKSLFFRDKRNVSLTVEGEELLGFAHRMIDLETEMKGSFHKPPLAGEVTFGTPEDLATLYLPTILGPFIQTYPSISLHVNCEFTVELLKGFESRLYDLVLIKQDPSAPHPRSEEVWKEPLEWVKSKQLHEFRIGVDPIPLILAPSPCVYRQRAIDSLNKEGIRWRVVYTSPSVTGTLAAVKAGLGIAVLPKHRIPVEFQIVRDLPPLKDAQIALLKQQERKETVDALANYIIDHILSV